VQLGLFAQHDNAERLLHSVQSKGFNAALTDRDAKGLYHVQIAHLSDRGAALAMQSRLREQGLAAAVIPPH
jgi:cell division protein FtsN